MYSGKESLFLMGIGVLGGFLLTTPPISRLGNSVEVSEVTYTSTDYTYSQGVSTSLMQKLLSDIEVPEELLSQSYIVGDSESSKSKDKLDFSGQQVIFNQDYFYEPVVMSDCHVTTYCNCEQCCGIYAGKRTTSTGTEVQEGVTIAVDPNIIPYGSIVELNGHFYIAEDCGGSIDGVEVDVYIEDTGYPHTRCKQFMKDLGTDVGWEIKVWVPKSKEPLNTLPKLLVNVKTDKFTL